MRFKYIIVFVFVFMGSSRLWSQEDSWLKRLYVEGNYHYGFLMPHSDYIAFFVKEHIQGFQLNIGLQTNGEKRWHQSYNFPRMGIGYYRSGLSNKNVYGEVNALFAYVDRYYLNWNKKINFGNRLSFGAAYVNKKFDLEENSTNLAIGSRLNAYINYSVEAGFRLFPKTELKIGGGISHVSNGNFQQPNKGLNFFTVFTGLTYSLNEEIKLSSPEAKEDNSKHQFLLMTSYGRKQISRKIDNSYSVIGVSGEYSHLLTGNSWGGAALNIYHDPSLEKELALSDTLNTNFSHRIRVALNLVYELKMGRISYVFQPGIYLRNPYKLSGVISNRISVRYQLTSQWNAGITIKAHWFAIADVFEWGIGYRWRK